MITWFWLSHHPHFLDSDDPYDWDESDLNQLTEGGGCPPTLQASLTWKISISLTWKISFKWNLASPKRLASLWNIAYLIPILKLRGRVGRGVKIREGYQPHKRQIICWAIIKGVLNYKRGLPNFTETKW